MTGKESSNILGTLGVEGGANLFLLNPNGILFGQNARLDLRGSFVATTANSFVFPNGLLFSATNPQAPPLLTITAPIGLQFGLQPGGITSQAVSRDSQGNLVNGLGIASASTLALIGGEITLDSSFVFAENSPDLATGNSGDITINARAIAGDGTVSRW
ncbi:filamentous hemagglutinin N-terminal domain-containing protein [Aetokthonos hydrillicola]|uniref:two-partner secretion domain-containing protein n=1 Tax=Aetokthonos hydrillicola TaxID=1550245 RepID=UPI0036F33699